MPLEVIVAVKQEDESIIHYSIYSSSLNEYDDPEQVLTHLSDAVEVFYETYTWGEVLEAAIGRTDSSFLGASLRNDYNIEVSRIDARCVKPPAPHAIVNAGDLFQEVNTTDLDIDLDITIDNPDLYEALYNELGAELRDELYTSMDGE